MNTSYDVAIYEVRERKDSKTNPFNVRWRVADKTRSKVFRTLGLAKGFRNRLQDAAQNGEPFDVLTGLPVKLALKEHARLAAANAVSTHAHFAEYIDHKWPVSAGNRRKALAEVLTDVTCALLPERPDRPDATTLRQALYRHAFNTRDRSLVAAECTAAALQWAADNAPPLTDLADLAKLRALLDALSRKQDGKPASASYYSKRRRILYNMLAYAVARKRLATVPLDDPELNWQKPSTLEVEDAIDPRSVGNVDQVERMLTAVSYVGRSQGPRFVAFFATVYYAMARPEEVADLRRDQCELPAKGWGRLLFARAAAAPGAAWTDDGDAHEVRALKHRGEKAVRVVPIPPRLVSLLRDHLARFGTAGDGRLFRTLNRTRILPSTYWRVWSAARGFGLTPVDRGTALLKSTYVLRHSGVSARLYAGVPDRQVAEWAGHSVEVLHRVYSRVLEGFDTQWNSKMDGVFGGDGPDGPEDEPIEGSGEAT
ncbi:site-specific integrase [Phytomonospora sp. NPDC050363]|uniref:tyrosine-type recombinase/integrase n=1 Tax=Phytomonospora sp. NPDC050363 TaxID=3155642 RepID=UPI0033D5E2CA